MNDLLLVEYAGFLSNFDVILKNYLLTKRESEIVFLINRGMKNRAIGSTLFISETTVKKHLYNIYNKCQINSRFELICIIMNYNHNNFNVKAC